MAARAHVINISKRGDLLQMRQPTTVHDSHAQVIDQLLRDQNVGIPDRVENFANSEGYHRVLADQAEAFLQFSRDRVLQPKQMIRFEALAQPCRFDRSEAMVYVVE